MACDGQCTFETQFKYEAEANGNVVSFSYTSSHSATKDCKSDIGAGNGWFRFQRNSDPNPIRITRNTLTGADPETGGNGQRTPPQAGVYPYTFSGGSLPTGVTVTSTQNDYTGIRINLGPNDTHFTSIDINVALSTECKCENNNNQGEQHLRFKYDSTAPAARRVSHNSSQRTVARPLGPTQTGGFLPKVITHTWTSNSPCNNSNISRTWYTRLGLWQTLDEQRTSGGISDENQRILDGLERYFEQQDQSLDTNQVATLDGLIWKKEEDMTDYLAYVPEIVEFLKANNFFHDSKY